jgi:uncharacterized protein with NRDE domain
MCVVFFTLDHPDYPLVLCSNRDEYLSRPTEPACFHSFGEEPVLSGIDVQAGGTWLGLSRSGKLAVLTNITEPHIAPACPSVSFDALYVTNRGAGGPITYRALTDAQRHRGGLSNGIDGNGADDWPKVQHGVHALDALLDTLPPNTSDDQLTERLFDLLMWRSAQPPRDRSELRNTIQVEPLHDAIDVYGTRLSTAVLVKHSGEVVFTERDRWKLDVQGQPILADPSSQRVFRFKIERSELSE